MADTKALRTRIKSVDSTLHLTKAMGLVAASKIKRATNNMNKGREYRQAVTQAVQLLINGNACAKSPYLKKSNGNKAKIVVIAGDRGLAGGYNANVFRIAKQYENSAEFIGIGKRACEKYGTELYKAEDFSYLQALRLSKIFCVDFAQGKYDKLGIIQTKYVSMMTHEAEITWVLPLEKNNASANSPAGVIFEPDELTILNQAITEYVAGILISSVRESFASELAARRCAMDSAGKNAQEMIADLSLQYNRARQGAITQEITEIVAGSVK